jgi:hypothetical protein
MTYLGTFDLPITAVQPYPGNPRQGNVKVIEESLRRNEQYRSIVVRCTDPVEPMAGGVVLAGNHTFRAARNIGMTTIRAEVHDVDEATARRIVAVDNRPADLGTYDDRLLAELLTGLDDLTGTGYDADDLDTLARSLEETAAPGTADLLDPPEENKYAEQYGVVVHCENAEQQETVYNELSEQGYNVKVVTV